MVKTMQDKAAADAAASNHKVSTSSLPASKPEAAPAVKATPPRSVSSVQLSASSSNTPAKTAANSPRITSIGTPQGKAAPSSKAGINIKHANLDLPGRLSNRPPVSTAHYVCCSRFPSPSSRIPSRGPYTPTSGDPRSEQPPAECQASSWQGDLGDNANTSCFRPRSAHRCKAGSCQHTRHPQNS